MSRAREQASPQRAVDEPARTFSVPQILFGPGTLSEVGIAARVFVVSDPGTCAT